MRGLNLGLRVLFESSLIGPQTDCTATLGKTRSVAHSLSSGGCQIASLQWMHWATSAGQRQTAQLTAAATVKALKLFCTPGFGGFLDHGLFQHVRDKVHILITDAASSELLASHLLRGRRRSVSGIDLEKPFFPNLFLLGCDASHACTRLLKQPWHVMDEVKEVVSCTITNSDSVAQKKFTHRTLRSGCRKPLTMSHVFRPVAYQRRSTASHHLRSHWADSCSI